MLGGLFGQLFHGSGAAGIIILGVLAAGYVVWVAPAARGLLLPALPLWPGGRIRRWLRISSYLTRGYCAAYFVAVWAIGLTAVYWIVTLGLAYKRDFSGKTFTDGMMAIVAYLVFMVFVLLGSTYFLVARLAFKDLRRWEQERVQRHRDRRAARTLAAIENGAPAPYGGYSIWLRPFISTGRIGVTARSTSVRQHTSQRLARRGRRFEVTRIDLETVLAGVMEPVAPVIALGKSGEQVGAGRVDVPDDRWQEVFALLARSARVIFLLPSTRDGTHWEIDFLMREPALLDRTVFLVPPVDSSADVRTESLQTLEDILAPDDYAAVAEESEDARSTLSGALFKLSSDGAAQVTALTTLQSGKTRWYNVDDGSRFDQSLFRARLLEMVKSMGRPRSPRRRLLPMPRRRQQRAA